MYVPVCVCVCVAYLTAPGATEYCRCRRVPPTSGCPTPRANTFEFALKLNLNNNKDTNNKNNRGSSTFKSIVVCKFSLT